MFRARQDNNHKAPFDRDLGCDHRGYAGCAGGVDPSSTSRGWVVVSNEKCDLGNRELNVIKGKKWGRRRKEEAKKEKQWVSQVEMVVILRVEVRRPEPNHGTVVRPHRLPLSPVSFIYHPVSLLTPIICTTASLGINHIHHCHSFS
jgi:hypothetical protein